MKLFSKILCILIVLLFSNKINALCYDNELNEWALGLEIELIDFNKYLINEETDKPLSDTMNYAYIIALNKDYRKDVVFKGTDSYDNNHVWQYIPGHKIWGIPDYNGLETTKYSLKVVGSEDSACPNEVIKSFEYVIDPFNLYFKTEMCEDYPDAPLCQKYKDTSNITEEKFEKEMDVYIKKVTPPKEPSIFVKFFKFFINYLIYILVPFILIAVFYTFKINRVKKEEANK